MRQLKAELKESKSEKEKMEEDLQEASAAHEKAKVQLQVAWKDASSLYLSATNRWKLLQNAVAEALEKISKAEEKTEKAIVLAQKDLEKHQKMWKRVCDKQIQAGLWHNV